MGARRSPATANQISLNVLLCAAHELPMCHLTGPAGKSSTQLVVQDAGDAVAVERLDVTGADKVVHALDLDQPPCPPDQRLTIWRVVSSQARHP